KPVWKERDIDTFYAVVGSTGNLTCEATSEPPPTFEWFIDPHPLGNSTIYKLLNEKYKSTLQVKVQSHHNLGKYLCLVSNTVGEIQKDMYLVEGVLPNTPSFTLTSEEPGALRVTIFPSPQDNLPITGYKIQWKQNGSSWKFAREYLTSAGTEFLIQDLNFDTDYAFRVSAQNEIGFSKFTAMFVQITKGLVAENTVNDSKVLNSTFSKSPPSRQKMFWGTPYIVTILTRIFLQPSMMP
ncbi:hemicentin-1, partial [Trichonephila clavata]